MKAAAWVWTPLLVLSGSLAAGCFDVKHACRLLCAEEEPRCPSGYECVRYQGQQVCDSKTRPICLEPPIDAAGDAEPTDVPVEPETGNDDTGPGVAPDAAPERLCFPAENCLTLTPALRNAVVLWLDPSNLPAAGSPIASWPDRSGRANHAAPINAPTLPVSTGQGANLQGVAFSAPHHPSLDLGRGDFAIYVVGRIEENNYLRCLYLTANRASGGARRVLSLRWYPIRQVVGGVGPLVELNNDVLEVTEKVDFAGTTPHLMDVARVGQTVHVHVDGRRVAPPHQLSSVVDVTTGEPIYLGTCEIGMTMPFVGAAVVLAGETPEPDRTAVREHLLRGFAIQPP